MMVCGITVDVIVWLAVGVISWALIAFIEHAAEEADDEN